MITADFPNNIIDFMKRFGDERSCLNYIRKQRWGSETAFVCPKCEHDKCWQGKSHEILYCSACNRQVSITYGTVFHKTRKSLTDWFMAMYLMTSSKQGMSAVVLQRHLEFGSYQTAWTCLQKLRKCMVDPDRTPLQGEVEVDETYIGGDAEGSARGRSTIKKTAVVCAVEKRGKACGRVRFAEIQNASKLKLKKFLDGKLEPETTVHTDGWRGYDGFERSGYRHIRTVSESKEAHINLPRVHSIFSLLKRWLIDTHQGAVSRKHLQSYLEEYTFRFNRRNAKKRTHLFQRLSEGSIREQCRPYWQIVGRSSGRVSMRQNINLADILGQPKKKYTMEEIMAMEPRG